MNILATNIKYYRKLHKMTQKDLANALDVQPTAISAWEIGRNKPLMDKIEQMSILFNIKKSELLGEQSSSINEKIPLTPTLQSIVDTSNQLEEKRQEIVLNTAKQQLDEQNNIIKLNTVQEQSQSYSTPNKENNKYGVVNLYGSISAGTGLDLYDEIVEIVRYLKPIPKHDIALRVYGDSMEPMFRNDEIVFIKTTQEINHGQIGAFIVNGMGFFKKFYKDKEGVRLVSLNRNYPDIIIGEYDDVRLVGTVVL